MASSKGKHNSLKRMHQDIWWRAKKPYNDIFGREEKKKRNMSEGGEEVVGLGLQLGMEAWLHDTIAASNEGIAVGVNLEDSPAISTFAARRKSKGKEKAVQGEEEEEDTGKSHGVLRLMGSPDRDQGESDFFVGVFPSNSPRTPLPPGTELDNFKLIDELLEENYRGQAVSFVRNARSARNTLTTNTPSNPTDASKASIATESAAAVLSRSVSDLSNTSGDQVLSPNGFYTPTRINPRANKNTSFAALQRSTVTPNTDRSRQFILPDRKSYQTRRGRVVVEAVGVHHSPESPHATYNHRIYAIPAPLSSPTPLIPKRRPLNNPEIIRGHLYFTNDERQAIAELVAANLRPCEHGNNSTDCLDFEYAHHENKAMSTSLPPEERQKIINNNRSLRNIKNELENLAESETISDEVYDSIMKSLPNESPLNGSARAPPPAVSTNAMAVMKVNDAPPPAYNTPPSLPSRQNTKPELTRAIALYRYAEPGDCNFEVGDHISVLEYMNADWWLGKNIRTGQEGVFPVNYVQATANAPSPHGAYGNEKAGAYQSQVQQGPPPPGPSNPYNSAVPPMQIAEQPSESKPGKGGEMGKKFGKKLGNAAIFGAGATIGGNIVNSIF
ncbi:hypothetical protein HYALB_00002879 [Hymenoscyphus albidus]|uniref:SH3 domain-containing protein n=1 Tax=Hymenoscyphus albidus TaxID=595503 RepID=A0A9N9LGD6_9HELO|nr:hypothetical protein HYALB_00002879 [Hymenoscyphus albidus]